MGKRCDFTSRTVITPDPNLEINEVGVPKTIALNMTIPERVSVYNMREMAERVRKGPKHLKGARYVERADGTRFDLTVASIKCLSIGDVVERPLQDGDMVVMNRQPSLHKMSMMGHRVKVMPYSTFRLNLSVVTPYNAVSWYFVRLSVVCIA